MDLSLLRAWIPALAILLGSLLAGYLARHFVLRRVARLTAHTKTDLDDLVLRATRGHIPFWFVLIGLALAAESSPITDALTEDVHKYAWALFFLSLSLVVANLLTAFVERATKRAGVTFVSASLTRNVLRGIVLVIGGLLILERLGQPIGSLLATLGIGSLAVALALQPTLSNLFAGMHITLAKPLRIGDFIELENGVQGFVVDVGWRATKLREPTNNLVIVPNARLVEMVAKNYALPESDQTVLLQIGVSYASDLEQVEAVTKSAASEVLGSLPEAASDFEPIVRFHTFGDSAIGLALVFRVKHFAERGAVLSALVKRIKARYDEAGIEIPFPQRVMRITREPSHD